MITETMTIHEALVELKTLDKRIESKISLATFVLTNKHSNTKISGKPIPDYTDEMASGLQSIEDLIARRYAIRNALAKSNSETIINVGGRDYTISTAIEMKMHGMELNQTLLNRMACQLGSAERDLDRNNGDRLSDAADEYVTRLYGSKDKSNADDIQAARKHYIEANTFDLIDPLNVRGRIEALRDHIDAFNSEVDSKIQVSNALTTIAIEY